MNKYKMVFSTALLRLNKLTVSEAYIKDLQLHHLKVYPELPYLLLFKNMYLDI